MFTETADENYILSRIAFVNRLRVDFFWLGLHAVEKYLKATLLLNGQSAKGYSHDIERLFAEATKLHPKLEYGPFADPQVGGAHWIEYSIQEFVTRLNRNGDPNNRYLTYGFYATIDDLLKLDQLVWTLRRHCRPLLQSVGEDRSTTIDWVVHLKKQPATWRLDDQARIERILDGEDSPTLRASFLLANKPFAPADHDIEQCSRMFFASNSPLVALYERAKSGRAGPEVIEALQWAVDNLTLSPVDAKDIKAVLTSFGNS